MSAQSTTADPRPPSDVSGWVGLVGLAGLFAWIVVCREWAAIADLLSMPGPRAPLSGPYAALAALLFAAGPMVLWSLLVDKVHRRKSTGIDWTLRRPAGSTRDVSITKLAGLWATFALIALFYCVARYYWRGPYLFSMEVIGAAALPVFVLSVPYVLWLDRYLVNPRDGAWHFGAMLIGREPYERSEVAHHLRAWTVKAFFTAFMVSILPGGFAHIVTYDFGGFFSDPVRFAMLLIEVLFLIDVQIGTVGYLLTMKPLDAQIRTANPYLAAWLAALICYPPFILMGDGGPLDYHPGTSDWAFWMEGHTRLLWAWGALLVVLTGIYAWATVAFGIRFSNLTYRGVLTNGPYAWTKHPAYLSKNLFWWCATLPFFATSGSWSDAVRNTALLALVSGVYYWRAKTEEKHLGEEDPKYRAYSAWMERHGPITRRLNRLGEAFGPRGPRLQPAE